MKTLVSLYLRQQLLLTKATANFLKDYSYTKTIPTTVREEEKVWLQPLFQNICQTNISAQKAWEIFQTLFQMTRTNAFVIFSHHSSYQTSDLDNHRIQNGPSLFTIRRPDSLITGATYPYNYHFDRGTNCTVPIRIFDISLLSSTTSIGHSYLMLFIQRYSFLVLQLSRRFRQRCEYRRV